MNAIFIKGLKLKTHIGVPDEERRELQTVEMDIDIVPLSKWPTEIQDIGQTIDYAQVVSRLESLASARPRHLVETLAQDSASMILDGFPVRSVTIEIRKHILAQTDSVGVRLSRSAVEGHSRSD